MKKMTVISLSFVMFLTLTGADGDGCSESPTSDTIQRQQQERILAEGTSQVGMPAIKNFRERKLMKDIIEMRDQSGLVTHTYLAAELAGKIGDKLCDSIGYPISAATQFTNPQKIAHDTTHYGITLPQADPNGLFSPASAEGTWVMCKNPNGEEIGPVYSEPRLIVSPFPLKANIAPEIPTK
jgi:hypothetical protein